MSITIETQSSTNAAEYKRNYSSSTNAQSMGFKATLFVIFLICSLAVFLLGANYSNLFPTNGNSIYAVSVSAVFLIASLMFKRSEKLVK